ncbi:L-lactate permease, partial [Neisseria meningitidis]
MALFLSIFPIVLLIWLMVKKNSMPSYVALPITAVLIYAIKLFYFGDAGMLLNATAASGLVKTLTPITVIFGAIMFNRMMETTGCIDVIRKWLATISPNPVAQLMIIGWAFAFMIEGASGFGTPAAIAAPILMSLGFNPLKVAIFTLVMNSVPVSFGAVGTPTWFGFAPLNLSAEDILA